MEEETIMIFYDLFNFEAAAELRPPHLVDPLPNFFHHIAPGSRYSTPSTFGQWGPESQSQNHWSPRDRQKVGIWAKILIFLGGCILG
ncbi:hypothetical protein IQ218_12120 [Synechocystis salina LEGE 06099]|nr:hypothetical protein [Synechocystis salina LEGE 06099]